MDKLKGMNKKLLGGIILAGIILVAVGLGYKYFPRGLNKDQAKTKVENYVKAELVQPGTDVAVKDISEDGELYRVVLDVSGQEIITYMTKDGKKFFPQVLDMTGGDEQSGAPAEKTQVGEVQTKKDIPEVELFVMSYCPYGTQIEKGILPVLDTLGSKIKFNLKFVDYAMHGEKELDENVRQYCIEKSEPAKLSGYLGCFLQKGEGTEAECLRSNSINESKVNSCISSTNKQFKVKEKLADKSTWSNGTYPPFDVNKTDNDKYDVKGSPTIIVNGEEVSSSRDSSSLLKTICSGFVNAPEECSKELPSVAPAPGFGEGTAAAGANSDAACGN